MTKMYSREFGAAFLDMARRGRPRALKWWMTIFHQGESSTIEILRNPEKNKLFKKQMDILQYLLLTTCKPTIDNELNKILKQHLTPEDNPVFETSVMGAREFLKLSKKRQEEEQTFYNQQEFQTEVINFDGLT